MFAVPPNIETLLDVEVIHEAPHIDSKLSEHAISVEIALDYFNQDVNGRIRDSGLMCCEMTKCNEKGKTKPKNLSTCSTRFANLNN